jgi:NADH-quinone oxidoreductase subunit C
MEAVCQVTAYPEGAGQVTGTLLLNELAQKIGHAVPSSNPAIEKDTIVIASDAIPSTSLYLKETDGLAFDYLVDLTAVDFMDYFEVVYHLTSLSLGHSLVLKTRCYDREKPVMPSVIKVWQGADLQEREVFDLMGITFTGHPRMKRLFLWEGFQGHPLRRDYL